MATTSTPAQAQPARLTIGMTGPLSGPEAAYGLGLRHGLLLAVARSRASGQAIELQALDDAGDAQRAAHNARTLLRQGVVALAGVHGAQATSAVAAVLAEAAAGADAAALAPLVGPATSADALRDPPRPGVFHLRAGAAEELSAALLHLDTVGLTRFAVLSQDDALGQAGRDSLALELVRMAMKPVAMVRLQGAEAGIRPALRQLCDAQPQAVVLALPASLVAAAVQAGRAAGCTAQYLVLSETGAALAAQAPAAAGPHPLAGLLVAQVVPSPSNLSHPLVADYQRALAAHGAAAGANVAATPGAAGPSYPSLEGYLAGRVITEALRACGRDSSRACLQQQLSGRVIDLPGLRVQLGTLQRQPRPFVEMSLLDAQGRFRR